MRGIGEALALLSGFSYAAAYVCVAKGSTRARGDNGAFLSVVTTALVAGLAWAPGVASRGLPDLAEHAAAVGWFALSGILTIICGRALFYASIARLGAIRAAAINRLNPFFSVALAAPLLGETITPRVGFGMGLIASGFAILIRRMLARAREGATTDTGRVTGSHPSPASYVYDPASALCYACGYIARKLGLHDIPDSNLGTMVGAVTAVAAYLALALFVERYRRVVQGLFADTTRWHVLSAVLISIGQLAQFAAIGYIEISRVVMITSTEVVFAIILSVYVLRTEPRPDAETIGAALLATGGVVLIAAP